MHKYKIVDYQGKSHKYLNENSFLTQWSRHRAGEIIHSKMMGPDFTLDTKAFQLDTAGKWRRIHPTDNAAEIMRVISTLI